jgi:hypothetical protein
MASLARSAGVRLVNCTYHAWSILLLANSPFTFESPLEQDFRCPICGYANLKRTKHCLDNKDIRNTSMGIIYSVLRWCNWPRSMVEQRTLAEAGWSIHCDHYPLFTTFFTNPAGIGTGFIGSLGYWLSQHDVARGSQPWYYYLIIFPLYEYLPLIGGIFATMAVFISRKTMPTIQRSFVLFLMWWAFWIFMALSLAGEKMPWLSTHIAVPFILLTGWWIGHLTVGAASYRKKSQLSPTILPRSVLRGIYKKIHALVLLKNNNLTVTS